MQFYKCKKNAGRESEGRKGLRNRNGVDRASITQLTESYYTFDVSARNKGLCPHSDNHQLRWWLCSFFHVYQNATKKSWEGLRRRTSRDFQFLGGYQVATNTTFSSFNGPVSREQARFLHLFRPVRGVILLCHKKCYQSASGSGNIWDILDFTALLF